MEEQRHGTRERIQKTKKEGLSPNENEDKDEDDGTSRSHAVARQFRRTRQLVAVRRVDLVCMWDDGR
jgi:hypothetical protein